MNVHRSDPEASEQPSEPGFVGDVRIGGYFRREAPSRLRGATVSFAPGARTPWKVNALGQTLVIIDGVGRAQIEGEEVVEVHAGDVVWCPPRRRHWDGATPNRAMTYVALQEAGDGGAAVLFGEAVTDEEYQSGTV